jgi:cytochrome c peroxidase
MEKNFSLFWGLSIQLYEATLVSDNSLFDRQMDGNHAMSDATLRGFEIFAGKGGCNFCHKGAEFTGAATSQLITNNAQGSTVEHMLMGDGNAALYDSGFYNIGVRPPVEDIGVGAADPFGNPLSFTRAAKAMAPPDIFSHYLFFVPLDQFYVNACNFQLLPCQGINKTFRDAVDGSFKTPTLRNVELTGPYFHNGSQATLEQVIEFYNRGGDRRGPPGSDTSGYGSNAANLAPAIQPLGLNSEDARNLKAFLMSLTDERVRWEMEPFDHPSLSVPNGQVGDEKKVSKQPLDNQAMDNLLPLPAVGRTGLAAKGLGPIASFDAGLK